MSDDGSLDDMERFELQLVVREAIGELPPEHRVVMELILRRLEEKLALRVSEISMDSGLSYATTRRRVMQALLMLEDKLRTDPVIQDFLEHTRPDRKLTALNTIARMFVVANEQW